MRKMTSTNSQNEITILAECPIYSSTKLISARWKTHILWFLRKAPLRFGEIRRSIPLATERMIALRLQELVADKLIGKIEKKEQIVYQLTPKGKRLIPVLAQLFKIGANYGEKSC